MRLNAVLVGLQNSGSLHAASNQNVPSQLNEYLYPMPVSFFSSQAMVLYANDASNLIDKFGRLKRSPRCVR